MGILEGLVLAVLFFIILVNIGFFLNVWLFTGGVKTKMSTFIWEVFVPLYLYASIWSWIKQRRIHD